MTTLKILKMYVVFLGVVIGVIGIVILPLLYRFKPRLGGIIGVVILLLLYRLMVVGKILIFETLGVGTLPTPPN